MAGLMLVDSIPQLRDFSSCLQREPTIEVVSEDKPLNFSSLAGPTYVLSVEDSAAVRAGTKFFCLLGCLYYHDVFGEKYETGFCWQFSPAVERGLAAALPYNVDMTVDRPKTHNFRT